MFFFFFTFKFNLIKILDLDIEDVSFSEKNLRLWSVLILNRF